MKSILLSISILLSTTFLFSQNNETSSNKGEISYGMGINIKQTNLISDDKNFSDLSEQMAYALEGHFYSNLTQRLILKGGLNISSYRFNLTDYSLIFGDDITPTGPDTSASYIKSKINWGYLGVPIELQFKIAGDKNRFYLKAGGEMMFNIYQSNKGEISESGKVRETYTRFSNPPNKLLALVTLGLGMDFNLNEKYRMYVEPNVEFGMTDVFGNDGILKVTAKSRVNNIGCKVGVRF